MPLLALTLDGELYEENSVRDDGKGIGRMSSFADEGSVMFGALSKREVKNRKIHQVRQKKLAQAKRAKAIALARAKALAEKKKQLAKARAAEIKKRLAIKSAKKKSNLHMKGVRQHNFGYEYNDLMGDIFEGFENEGQVVGPDFNHIGMDFKDVDAFGTNTMLHDEGLGWGIKIKAPKVKVSAPKITMPKNAAAAIKDVGKIAAKSVTAPVQLSTKLVKATPLLKDVYKGVDKITGGSLSSIERVVDLPNKLAAGKPISKAQLMEAVMVAVKVGAIAASGGSAASLVSAGAGMLKEGPLGKSNFGKNILTLAEVGGAAAAIHQAATAQATKEVAKESSKKLAAQATKEVSKEVAQKTMQQSVTQAVKAKGIEMAQEKAISEVQRKTGIPVGLIRAAYDTSKLEGSIATKAKAYAVKIGDDKLKAAGLGGSMRQAVLSGNAEALGVMIKDAPNLAMSQAQREMEAKKVQLKNQLTLDGMKAKLDSKIAKAKKDATDIEALKDRLDKEANEAIKSELSKQLASMVASNEKTKDEIVKDGMQYQVEAAQTAVKVAAAEEGRYDAGMDNKLSHPILEVHKKWSV